MRANRRTLFAGTRWRYARFILLVLAALLPAGLAGAEAPATPRLAPPEGPAQDNPPAPLEARQIIFICQASGSMINKMATLKTDLKKAVGGLKPIHSFNIIFFQDDRFIALDPKELLVADVTNKRKAYLFLDDVAASGTSNPIPALTLAFKQHPQMVYLLADHFADSKAVKTKIAELNSDHKVKINTIAFIDKEANDKDSLDLLEQIAKDSGGVFSKVTESELNKPSNPR
jgi:hypothetical protein